jgi:uncharacterized protein (TIGR00730 family)
MADSTADGTADTERVIQSRASNRSSDPLAGEATPIRPVGVELNSSDAEISPSWRIFRIMSEFVEGFTFLAGIQRSVTIFGSARLSEDNPYYGLARDLAHRLAERGYTVVTGGGPGIMQAANQGATEASGDSVGINIQLPHEQRVNPFVKRSISFHYFFSRKVMLDFSAEAYIFFPGGYGTLDEFFELVTLVQTHKISTDVPIILIGAEYWTGLVDWMERVLLRTMGTIEPGDLRIWTLTDDLDQAVRIVEHSIETQVEQRIAETGHAVKTPGEKLSEATRPMSGSEQ